MNRVAIGAYAGVLLALAFSALTFAAPARADTLRDYCPDRPGMGTPSCIIDTGHVSVEIGLGDWTLDRNADSRTDQILLGDLLVRYGVNTRTEVEIGWTAYGQQRMRDRASGSISTQHRTGDITLALRRNIMHPDGSGFSLSVMPHVTLPTGREPLGAGDWSAGLTVPLSFPLTQRIAFALTPEIDAATDADGAGRHLAFGTVAGLSTKLDKAVSATIEYQAMRDDDPASHATQSLAGLSLAWMPNDALQLDIGSNIGLNADSPDAEVYVGVSRRF